MTRLAGAILAASIFLAGCATDNEVRIAYYTGPNGEPVPVLELPGVQCPPMLGGSGPIPADSRGCASQPVQGGQKFPIAFYELDLPALTRVCSGKDGVEEGLEGCYRWIDGVCTIYTLPRWVFEARRGLEAYHETLGHEADHCRRGPFHGRDRGVHLPGGRFHGLSRALR